MDAEDEDQDGTDDATPAGVPALGPERLSAALESSLAALAPEAQDGALAALLGMYARELDGASAAAARAARVARDVAEAHGRESALYEQVQALQALLSRRNALDKIGARFHAGLVEMLGTPKARGAGKPGVPRDTGAEPDAGSGGALVQLRLASGAE